MPQMDITTYSSMMCAIASCSIIFYLAAYNKLSTVTQYIEGPAHVYHANLYSAVY